jgi:hypothetical protein
VELLTIKVGDMFSPRSATAGANMGPAFERELMSRKKRRGASSQDGLDVKGKRERASLLLSLANHLMAVPSWFVRPSVNARRRAAQGHDRYHDQDDRSENEALRLPRTESVRLSGLVLAEAFAPSAASALGKALRELPAERPADNESWINYMNRGRSGSEKSFWHSLGVIRRPDARIRPGLYSDIFLPDDPSLPEDIDAVWINMHYPVSSVAIVVATFLLAEDASDLSEVLRADYQSEGYDVQVTVQGPFGRLRTRIPWARPAHYRMVTFVRSARDKKRLARESFITGHEKACWQWLGNRFPGRFGIESLSGRPIVRLFVTEEQEPFVSHEGWLTEACLDDFDTVWQAAYAPPWRLKLDDWIAKRRCTAIAAVRRREAIRRLDGRSGDTPWDLIQQFQGSTSPLIARWALTCLLAAYSNRLGRLRDQAGRPRRVSMPVRQARELDRYLIADGLDATTVASDLNDLMADPRNYALSTAEYKLEKSAPRFSGEPEMDGELGTFLGKLLADRAGRLQRDTAAAMNNIQASAELRQAIAGTRLNRTILVLTIVATIIAVVSLLVTTG